MSLSADGTFAALLSFGSLQRTQHEQPTVSFRHTAVEVLSRCCAVLCGVRVYADQLHIFCLVRGSMIATCGSLRAWYSALYFTPSALRAMSCLSSKGPDSSRRTALCCHTSRLSRVQLNSTGSCTFTSSHRPLAAASDTLASKLPGNSRSEQTRQRETHRHCDGQQQLMVDRAGSGRSNCMHV